MIVQKGVIPPVDLDPDPSWHSGEEVFSPLDDYYLFIEDGPNFWEFPALDGDVNDGYFVFPPPPTDHDDENGIHYVFPPLDCAGDDDHGIYKIFLVI